MFPNSLRPSDELRELATAFDRHMEEISSTNHSLSSNDVLAVVADDLEANGYLVEKSKRAEDLIRMPVLFGEQGALEKEFYADAYHPEARIVLEVEAGRAVASNQFLKDLFEACMMEDSEYLCIAVRKQYAGGREQPGLRQGVRVPEDAVREQQAPAAAKGCYGSRVLASGSLA